MADQKKSKIVRSWKTTLYYLIGGVVLGGISVVLFMTIASGPITIGIACIPAVVALICFFSAVSGAGESTCPGCDKPLSGLGTGSNDGVLCHGCLQYFEGKAGELWATDPARIADSPTFTSPLPEKFAFPEGCCVCRNAITQRVPISMSAPSGGGAVASVATAGLTDGALSVSKSTRITIEVPHCAEHKDGASLTGTKEKTHIRFRSYPYLRAFCDLNNTKPG